MADGGKRGGCHVLVGAAILTLSVTASRSYLGQFARPLVVLGTVWLLLDLAGLNCHRALYALRSVAR